MYTIADIMTFADFPAESFSFFQSAVTETIKPLLAFAAGQYMQKETCEPILDRIAAEGGMHRFTADMMMLLTAACTLGDIYRTKGYPESLFRETVLDLGYKLKECIAVYGIHGTFVLPWFDRFYDCTRFKLGRLQFETVELEEDYPGFGTKGETVLNCHIPSCGPMTMEDVRQSLDMAYRFYDFKGPMTVMCASWMLYPPHYSLFPEGSNLQKFYHLFQLAEQKSFGHNHDAWRIFGTADEDFSKWPVQTALQKNFHAYLSQGNVMGYGRGFLFYTPSSV